MSFDVRAFFSQKKIFLLLLLFANTLFADQPIIITAERITSNTEKSSSDVRVITAEDIANKQSSNLPELLSKESDLNVASSGPNGSNSSLFIRGTDSSHTLVVIDGIVMNDPSNPNRQYDIGRQSLNNIEKIEILKGSQGLAYGSNAIGGVVVITTKKALSQNVTGASFIDYGSFNTFNLGTNFQKKHELLNLSFGADVMKSDGFSAANQKVNPYAEKDGNQRRSFNLGINKAINTDYILDANLFYTHNVADIDKGGGAGNDDPNDLQKEEEIYSKVQLTKNWNIANAQTILSLNRSKHYRKLEVQRDIAHPASSNTITKGEFDSLNVNHTYYINDYLTQNIFFEFSHEKDQSKHYNQNISGFLYHQLEFPSDIINFGIRLDHNKYFKDHLTFKLALGHQIFSSLLKASFSTGFRSPSLNQLYDPTSGNLNLIPETSQSSELSLETKWSYDFKTMSALFYTQISNRFSYHPVSYVNLNNGQAEIFGFEQNFNVNWAKNLNHNLALTLLHARDLTNHKKLARRPDFNLKNTFSLQIENKHNFSYEFSYVGNRADVDNLGNFVVANDYLLSHLNYRYTIDDHKNCYLKIKNLFNTEYEEIAGYGTGGRAATIGMQYIF